MKKGLKYILVSLGSLVVLVGVGPVSYTHLIKKFEVYRHRSRHEIGMWKCKLFGSGAIRCLFLILFRKNRVLTIKKKQKVGRYQEYCLLLRSEFEQTEKNGCDEDLNE